MYLTGEVKPPVRTIPFPLFFVVLRMRYKVNRSYPLAPEQRLELFMSHLFFAFYELLIKSAKIRYIVFHLQLVLRDNNPCMQVKDRQKESQINPDETGLTSLRKS